MLKFAEKSLQVQLLIIQEHSILIHVNVAQIVIVHDQSKADTE